MKSSDEVVEFGTESVRAVNDLCSGLVQLLVGPSEKGEL